MGIYDRAAATAKRLIVKYGQQVVWQQNTDTTEADPLKPWLANDSVKTDIPVSIVFLPEGRLHYEFLALLEGTNVPKGKLTGLMAVVEGFVPNLKGIVVRGDERYAIRSLEPLAPNGQVLLYTIGFDL